MKTSPIPFLHQKEKKKGGGEKCFPETYSSSVLFISKYDQYGKYLQLPPLVDLVPFLS